MELKICHLYPDVLNMSGDGGNLLCLEKRLLWRGIAVSVEKFHLGQKRSLLDFDLVYAGGPQEPLNPGLVEDLKAGRARDIKAAIEDGLVFLAVGGGFEMLGKYYETAEGKRTELCGAVDMYTKAEKSRITGDFMFRCGDKSGGSRVVAFENHAGRIYLAEGLEPLGRIISGKGNNGTDGGEGLRYKNLFAGSGHGPLLPKNPALADFIIKTALERKYGQISLAPLDDGFEMKAQEQIVKRLEGGK